MTTPEVAQFEENDNLNPNAESLNGPGVSNLPSFVDEGENALLSGLQSSDITLHTTPPQ